MALPTKKRVCIQGGKVLEDIVVLYSESKSSEEKENENRYKNPLAMNFNESFCAVQNTKKRHLDLLFNNIE